MHLSYSFDSSALLLTLLALVSLDIVPTTSFRVQSVGVRGYLKCGQEPLNGTVVKLWDEDAGSISI
ncbi:unnamed protein product [Anisakis simplex]|uniref:Transthyretin-like family protein n=1 Tax=Anisakis simplex TaxID=6269 RepID=A0A0M3JIB9_ANISI|nr:unnamed protein product [Anisakis simplex]